MLRLLPLLALAFCASAFSAPPEPTELTELKAALDAADRAGVNVREIRTALAALEPILNRVGPEKDKAAPPAEFTALRAAVERARAKGEKVDAVAKALERVAARYLTDADLAAKEKKEKEFTIARGVTMTFCWIPAGAAKLGSPATEEGRFKSEDESAFATDGFWLGKYEVTQAQYEGVTGTNPSQFRLAGGRTAPNYPVESVNWHAAAAFGGKCFVEGHTVCLPSSDQWEYAARGGLGNKRPFYWGDAITSEHAAMQGAKPYGTDKATPNSTVMPVGSYEKVVPHPWGLCDMVGNVAEWTDSKEGSWFRIVRGGCWRSSGAFCRIGFRVGNNPNAPFKNSTVGDDRGFRVALVPDRK